MSTVDALLQVQDAGASSSGINGSSASTLSRGVPASLRAIYSDLVVKGQRVIIVSGYGDPPQAGGDNNVKGLKAPSVQGMHELRGGHPEDPQPFRDGFAHGPLPMALSLGPEAWNDLQPSLKKGTVGEGAA